MKKKVTLSNIKQYIQGYKNMFLMETGNKPEWYQEQIAYRMLQCKNDCMITRECKYCGCAVPGKLFVDQSCNNGERFPNIMNEEEWIKYKEENGIK